MATPNENKTVQTDAGQEPVTAIKQVAGRSLNEAILEASKLGLVICVGEWRGYKPEEINYTSSKDGSKQLMKMVRHAFECGDGELVESVSVSQNLAESFDLATVKSIIPFTKGQRVIIVCGGYQVEKGVRKIRALEMWPIVKA